MVRISKHTASITVNNNTTLEELHTFASKLKGNEGIRAKKNLDNTHTLYASTGRGGIRNFFDFKSSTKSETARTLIRNMMTDHVNNVDGKLRLDKIGALFKKDGNTSLRGDTLFNLMKEVSGASNGDRLALHSLKNGGETSIRVMQSVAECIKRIASRGGEVSKDQGDYLNDSQLDLEISNLAARLEQGLDSDEVRKNYPDFMHSQATRLKADVFEHLLNFVGKDKSDLMGHHVLKAVADKAVNRMLGNLAPAKMPNADTVRFNGVNYVRGVELGTGSYGKVFEFTGPQNRKIAVKFSHTDQSSIQETIQECKSHMKSQGQGHDHVLKVHGLGRSENGGAFIVMERAGGGDLDALAVKLTDVESRNLVAPEKAFLVKLTMIKDMLEGLNNVHKQNMAHLDFKPANVFLDDNGFAKVADFGLTDSEGRGGYYNFNKADSIFLQSPEVLIYKSEIDGIESKDKIEINL